MKRVTTICIALVLAAGTGWLSAQTSAQAEKALESARHKEVLDGDLKGAIEQYRKIASQFGKQPEIAARALYQLGQCQEKLGLAEARQSYERIVREYASASQYAGMARSRLAAMGGTQGGGVRARLLWDKAADLFGTTTPDGRFYCYPDRDTGDLGLRDLVAGQSRRVTNKGGYDKAMGFVEWCAVAPDGKRIAFTWDITDKGVAVGDRWELHVVGADGKDERTLFQGKDVGYLNPGSWSPDMKWIATRVSYQNGDFKLVLVSPDGAPARTLLTLQSGPGPNGAATVTFSPDGKWLAFHYIESGIISLYVLPADGSASAATKVASDATLSMKGWTPDGKALLFTRQFAGAPSLYLLPVANGKAAGEPQAIPIPSVIGDYFLGMTAQGTLIHGYFKRTTVAVTLPLDSGGTAGAARITMPITSFGLAPSSSASSSLRGGIRYSPDGKRVLYTTSDKIIIRSMADGSEHTVTPQMERRGRVEWAADSNSLLISGATEGGQDGVYQVDLRSGAATFLFAALWTLPMAASPDGTAVLYRKRGGSYPVVTRDLKTGSERTLVEDGTTTLDLKLSRDGKKLALVAAGSLRIVDVATGRVQTLYPPADLEASTSTGLRGGDWSPDGQRFFVFASMDNPSRSELWTFPVNGGQPARQSVAEDYRGLWVSPDGKQLATIRWEFLEQVLALENFLPAAK